MMRASWLRRPMLRVFALGLLGLPLALSAMPQPRQAAVASAHPLATAAGQAVLEAGGNAFDAAIAVTAALGVVDPGGSGMGGGGFYLLHEGKSGRKHFIDAREKAPLQIRGEMYLGEDGKPERSRLSSGPLAAGIPGIPAGLIHLAKDFAKLPLAQNLEPAIQAAEDGFLIDTRLGEVIKRREAHLSQFAATRAIWYHDGKPLQSGDRLVQKDLANSLRKLAAFGRSGFYAGPVADEMIRSVRAAGGVWTQRDLDEYQVVERRPLIMSYGDWQIVSAPPPSSGGLVLGEVFNMLSLMGYEQARGINRKHMLIEAMRRAYHDRARYMGDPDYVDVPSRQLLAMEHAQAWLESFEPKRATPSKSLSPEPIASVGMGMNTTHFSVIDSEGNRVAATLSLNYLLGSGFVAGKTGILLNNEMDDFVIVPGVPNAYGLIGGEANLLAPGKRMLSSMTPTFLEGADSVAALGTPGGSRIISMVLLALLDLMEGGTAESAVALPRFHHQYLPDVVQFGPNALSSAEQKSLRKRGHTIREMGWDYGNMQVVRWDLKSNQVSAASDPRGEGAAVVIPIAGGANP